MRQKVLRLQVVLRGETVGSANSGLVASGVWLSTGTRRRAKGSSRVGTSQQDSQIAVRRFGSSGFGSANLSSRDRFGR